MGMDYSCDAQAEKLINLVDQVKKLEQEKAAMENKLFCGLDKDASFDIGKLLKELWKFSDTGDYGSITLKEIVSLWSRCRT